MLQTILKCIEIYYRLGFTLPEIDKVMEPYLEKSYNKYVQEYYALVKDYDSAMIDENRVVSKGISYALQKITRDIEQGVQQWEYQFNTLSSSRGDYPKQNWDFI